MPVDLLPAGEAGVARAVERLRAGEVIGFPTDTVYGLAVLAGDRLAVRRVYEVKGRPLNKPLIVMPHRLAEVEQWAVADERAHRLMDLYWPGPLTLLLPARPGLRPPLVSGEPRSVALRVPGHPVALALLAAVGEALATTSANRSGEPAALQPIEAAWVEGVTAVIDGGPTPGGSASTLLDLTGPEPRILRPGPITAEELLSRAR